MKKSFFFGLMAILAISACKGSREDVSSTYKNDTEMIGLLINNDLINSDDISELIVTNGDDAVILEMILGYNDVNDPDKFIGNNGKTISKDTLKKKMLLLSNNLR
jgi:hypothetical protein